MKKLRDLDRDSYKHFAKLEGHCLASTFAKRLDWARRMSYGATSCEAVANKGTVLTKPSDAASKKTQTE